MAYCLRNNIAHKIVRGDASSIVPELADCRAFLWHWLHYDYTAALFARQLTYSLEQGGVLVFPSTATAWHYDDKVGQKYLLESIGAPLAPAFVAYTREEAEAWAKATTYPKVFKLRSGAGSENVRLVTSLAQARTIIRQAFGTGTKGHSRLYPLRERFWEVRRDRTLSSALGIVRGVGRIAFPPRSYLNAPIHRGYVYFQHFIPDNDHDIRVIVVGRRAFAIKRMVRSGDFRASGSGRIIYDRDQIPEACLEVAFSTTRRLGAQCLAYDFVFDHDNQPLIVEISYSFNASAYLSCPGHWTEQLDWIPGRFKPEDFIIEDLLSHTALDTPCSTPLT